MVKEKNLSKTRWRNIENRAELRKLFLIQSKLPYCHLVLDLGSGSGVYIPYLSQKAKHVVALDIKKEKPTEVTRGNYEFVLADAKSIPFRNGVFDALWASEIIEHFSCLEPLDELERVTHKTILITMPNPLSPHFKRDPAHILKYSVTSLEKYFKNRSRTTSNRYIIRGLGYDAIPMPKILKIITTFATWFIPILAPTITVIVTKKMLE